MVFEKQTFPTGVLLFSRCPWASSSREEVCHAYAAEGRAQALSHILGGNVSARMGPTSEAVLSGPVDVVLVALRAKKSCRVLGHCCNGAGGLCSLFSIPLPSLKLLFYFNLVHDYILN